jgi:hypothetical protein
MTLNKALGVGKTLSCRHDGLKLSRNKVESTRLAASLARRDHGHAINVNFMHQALQG